MKRRREEKVRAEETLQFMMDFYPELFPSRKHCLNYLFCTIGNGYDWRKGELVDRDCEFSKRYRLAQNIERAKPRNEEYYQMRLELEKEIREQKGDSYQITPQNIKYNFEWITPSKDYSYIYHYPKNIREDWLALLKECEQMLIEAGVIQGDGQKEGLEEQQEQQSGGMICCSV